MGSRLNVGGAPRPIAASWRYFLRFFFRVKPPRPRRRRPFAASTKKGAISMDMDMDIDSLIYIKYNSIISLNGRA